MPKISKIEASVPVVKVRKHVAAYARVSMDTEELRHSLSAQVSYYSRLIQGNPEWEYAGVYADKFISGTGKEKREEFKRMIADCEAGRIHIILTKSISRFARNTVDLLETVRHLRDIGVEVRFERERISTLDKGGEFLLTLLASFAEEEVWSISANTKWGIQKRMRKGMPHLHFQIYGYRWEGDELAIVPEEADVVRRIYRDFLAGKARKQIVRELNADGIPAKTGGRWTPTSVHNILDNVTYTGCLLLQKRFVTDPISKHVVKNRGELPQYFVENSHPAIVSRAEFDAVREERQRIKELGAPAYHNFKIGVFACKVRCPACHLNYVHRVDKKGNGRDYWCCKRAAQGKGRDGLRCSVGGGVNTVSLMRACADVLGLEEFDEGVFHEKVDFISIPERNVAEFHFKDGRVMLKGCPNTGHKSCWTPEARARASETRKIIEAAKRREREGKCKNER